MNDHLLSEIEQIAARRWQEWDQEFVSPWTSEYLRLLDAAPPPSAPAPPPPEMVKVAEWSPDRGLVLFGELRRQYERRRRYHLRHIRFTALSIGISLAGFTGMLLNLWWLCMGAAMALFTLIVWIVRADRRDT